MTAQPNPRQLTLWIDARCGVAGDMLLGALLDAGADLDVVRRDVEAVMPDTVRLTSEAVTRGVMRGTKLHVESLIEDHHHRAWRDIREMPSGTMRATGIGAGTKDGLPWANVVRAVLVDTAAGSESSQPEATDAAALTSGGGGDAGAEVRDLLVLEANIDDLDPRAWPSVIEALLPAGALDAWLTPIVMKKGRPAHTVSALVDPEQARPVRDAFFAHTTTLGVRESRVVRHALERTWHEVAVNIGGESAQVRIKVGHRATAGSSRRHRSLRTLRPLLLQRESRSPMLSPLRLPPPTPLASPPAPPSKSHAVRAGSGRDREWVGE